MPKPPKYKNADAARRALAAYKPDEPEDLQSSIQDLITDLGHLCDAEEIDFIEGLCRSLRHLLVERIDPNSALTGPTVDIIIGTEGLPPPPTPKPRRQTKSKKMRVPR